MSEDKKFVAKQLPLHWIGDPEMVSADEISFSYLGDKVYFTFGEVQPPSPNDAGTVPTSVIVHAVARIALSEQAFRQLNALFGRAIDTVDEVKKQKEKKS
ncbi:MAG: hypothetical protein ABJB66_20760 [Gemmatimonadaceae bacterium]